MPIYLVPEHDTPLSQGDIFKDVPYWRPHRKSKTDAWPNPTQRGNLVLDLQISAYAVLATHSCDVSKATEFLFVSAMPAEAVARALAGGEAQMSDQEFRNWIVKNLHPRYHFFERFVAGTEPEIEIIPELVVNFRNPFTLRAEYVKEKLMPDHRVLCLQEIYGAEFGNRFGQFYSRVATDRNMESI